VSDERDKILREGIMQGIGWMYAEACACAEKGVDIRNITVPCLIERAEYDLALGKP
jgi:hypothetical protein